jgi:hypothetical protein
MGHDEAAQLPEGIAVLRAMLDHALRRRRCDFVHACADILKERKERLEELEGSGLRQRYERALP